MLNEQDPLIDPTICAAESAQLRLGVALDPACLQSSLGFRETGPDNRIKWIWHDYKEILYFKHKRRSCIQEEKKC